ncbi:asparagine synthase-related protein [Rhodococcus sp. 1168]|uniref:asparagine synthase-related protein n=1 Tax=Rhodococcus sp. 1168 TaxID=2018041 RepID=UPI001592B683|nr:asparagine synthase-related protein [Rhodococcus sp. 1168]
MRNSTVASNRADILADLSNSDLDAESIAVRLLVPPAPDPLDTGSMWSAVHPVPADRQLSIHPDGHTAAARWWTAPPADMSIADTTEALRVAISEAVALRTGDEVVTADLSGGLDSTPLAYLAWNNYPNVSAVTLTGMTEDDGDTGVALTAASMMAGLDHLMLPVDKLVNTFDGIITPPASNDEPFFGLQLGRQAQIAEQMSQRGSALHFTGHGGDEVFSVPSVYLGDLLRTNKRVGLDHARGLRALNKWSWSDVVNLYRDTDSYQKWTNHKFDLAPERRSGRSTSRWGEAAYVPAWVTRDALQYVRRRFENLDKTLTPHSPSPAQHQCIESIRTAGRISRLAGNIYAQHGISLAYPLIDDKIVDLALRVRLHERGTPWEFKPLLRSATAKIVPPELMSRSTKNDMTEDVYRDLRSARESLREMCENSVLVSMGLVDRKELLTACGIQHAAGLSLPSFVMTMNCEAWLRSQLPKSHRKLEVHL